MLAYASNRPLVGKREQSPNALLLIISVHVALLAAVMSSKVDVGRIIHHDSPLINVPIPPAPPPPPGPTTQSKQPREPVTIDHPNQIIKAPPAEPTPLPPTPDTGARDEGTKIAMGGEIPQPPTTVPIRHAAQLLTPASELKPPYPASKLAAEQEATLQLSLTIDERGRVTAVQPIGYADRAFLDAARRYIIAHWRYRPATEDGRAMPSTLDITLRFQLDG